MLFFFWRGGGGGVYGLINTYSCTDLSPQLVASIAQANRPFPSCFEPPYENEATCNVFVMKISFHSYANKTNYHMKRFALRLAFLVRFTATRKWPIYLLEFALSSSVVVVPGENRPQKICSTFTDLHINQATFCPFSKDIFFLTDWVKLAQLIVTIGMPK